MTPSDQAALIHRWISTLRTEPPSYPRCTGQLHTESGFCPLGVLADLYISDHPSHSSWKRLGEEFVLKVNYPEFSASLPRWLTPRDLQEQIVTANDDPSASLSWPEIAQKIESYFSILLAAYPEHLARRVESAQLGNNCGPRLSTPFPK